MLDAGTVERIKRGQIKVFAGVEAFEPDGAVFTDGRRAAFEAVILATGYRPQVQAFLEGVPSVYDDSGTPLASGQALPVPGLYFCGYRVTATGQLREIGLEARRIAKSIAEHSKAALRRLPTPPAES